MNVFRIRNLSKLPMHIRAVLVVASFLLYAALFSFFYRSLGGVVIALSVLPVISSGWILGLRGGVLAGLGSYPLNAFLFALVNFPDWQLVIARGAVGHVMLVTIGAMSGWVSSLIERVQRQAQELEIDRKKLKELLSKGEEDKVKLEDREKHYRKIVEGVGDVVWIIDTAGKIEYINASGTVLTEFPQAKLVGMNIDELIDPTWRRRVQDFYDEQINYRLTDTTFVFPILTRSGRTKWVEQNTNILIDDGRVTGLQSSVRDVTERKRQEEALTSSHAEALAASNFKSQLLANVSHELRTPLNAIMGYAEILASGRFEALTDGQNEMLARVISSTEQMTTLVNNLLDQAQIEDGKLKLRSEKFSPDDLLSSIQKVLVILATTKSIELKFKIDEDVPRLLIGDYQRLHQIMMNLINNAIKFTDKGGVSVRIFVHDDSHWALRVSDTGKGIPAEAQEYIFEAFRQADSSVTRKFAGAGLGLSIVKNITHQMDGEIYLESQPGEGSTFTVVLPIVQILEAVP